MHEVDSYQSRARFRSEQPVNLIYRSNLMVYVSYLFCISGWLESIAVGWDIVRNIMLQRNKTYHNDNISGKNKLNYTLSKAEYIPGWQ